MSIDLSVLRAETEALAIDVITQADSQVGDIFVLGCSSSEVMGGVIGQNSSQEVGVVIIKALVDVLQKRGIYLAVQGCEHLNRALVVERELALEKGLEIVSVLPTLDAGGACSVAAFERFEDPVEVEFIVANVGIDVGDTAIGMHIKHVAIPIRSKQRLLGKAHVTALGSRPKLIGGSRSKYA